MRVHGGDAVKRNLDKYWREKRGELVTRMEYAMSITANWSQQHAPWTDRTSNARNSLYGTVDGTQKNKIIGYHGIGVFYGVFLELSNYGKYRIVKPANDWIRVQLLRILTQ